MNLRHNRTRLYRNNNTGTDALRDSMNKTQDLFNTIIHRICRPTFLSNALWCFMQMRNIVF